MTAIIVIICVILGFINNAKIENTTEERKNTMEVLQKEDYYISAAQLALINIIWVYFNCTNNTEELIYLGTPMMILDMFFIYILASHLKKANQNSEHFENR